MNNFNRRDFLKKSLATTLGFSLIKPAAACSEMLEEIDELPIPKRRLGKTGYDVTIVSLGGQSTIEQSGKRAESVEIINRALDLGINYIDTAEAYGDGISEEYIGEVMKDRRDEVFLTTKTFERKMHTLEEENFENSCRRLQTDYIDLYLMHNVSDMDALESALDPDDGAINALQNLKEKGRIGYIGISSHSTEVITEALERVDLDCVFLTLNPAGIAMNQSPKQTREFLKMVKEKDVGLISMKVTGRNDLFNTGISMEKALRYSLSAGGDQRSFPVATAAIGITEPGQLDENVRLAKRFKALSEEEMDELETA